MNFGLTAIFAADEARAKAYEDRERAKELPGSRLQRRDSAYMPLAEKYANGTATDAEVFELAMAVQEAADEAMPNTKVRSKRDGQIRKVYHYTNRQFWQFKPSERSFGSSRTHGTGYYVSTSETEYSNFGKRKISMYADIQTPFEMNLTEEQAQAVYEKYFRPHHEDRFHTYEQHVINALQSSFKVFDYLKEAAETNNTTTDAILSELGFDGVHDGSLWVAFDSSQLKEADPVTYDDDGDIIPLSERFRTDRTGEEAWKNEDIRYRVKEEDKKYVTFRDYPSIKASINSTMDEIIASHNTVPIPQEVVAAEQNRANWDDYKDARRRITEILKDFLGVDVMLGKDGKSVQARLTRDGLNHAIKSGNTPTKAAIFTFFADLTRNAVYSYSTIYDAEHSLASARITQNVSWDNFVAVAEAGDVNVPVVFEVRSTDSELRSHIRDVWVRKEANLPHGAGEQENLDSRQPNDGDQLASIQTLSQPETVVNPESESRLKGYDPVPYSTAVTVDNKAVRSAAKTGKAVTSDGYDIKVARGLDGSYTVSISKDGETHTRRGKAVPSLKGADIAS